MNECEDKCQRLYFSGPPCLAVCLRALNLQPPQNGSND